MWRTWPRIGFWRRSAASRAWEFGESPTPRARAVLDRLEAGRERPDVVLVRVAAGHLVGGDRDDARVLDVVVERADAIVDFILDPTRVRRSDRVRDVGHSRAADPWGTFRPSASGGPLGRIPLGIAIGVGVGGWWTSARGWPAEGVAVVAGALSVSTSEPRIWVRRCRVGLVGLGFVAVGSVSRACRRAGFMLLAAAVADAELAVFLGRWPHECMR